MKMGIFAKKCKIMGISKLAYFIWPFVQMGIFFLKWAYLPNMPKKKLMDERQKNQENGENEFQKNQNFQKC